MMIKATEAREIAQANLEKQTLYQNIEKSINESVTNSQNSAAIVFTEADYVLLPVMVSELYKLGYSTRIDKTQSTLFVHW